MTEIERKMNGRESEIGNGIGEGGREREREIMFVWKVLCIK